MKQDLSAHELLQEALQNKEGVLSKKGAFVANTGKRTGRSPKDKFIVDDATTHSTVDWGRVNQPISAEAFDALWAKATAHISNKTQYVSHLGVGADPQYYLPVTVTTDTAWQNLFVKHLLIHNKVDYSDERLGWELLSVSTFQTDPARDGVNSDGTLIINFSKRKVLLCGLRYAGELKKSMFSVMNYLMPERDVLPMHCAANVGEAGDVALFFGLSGTGKTTLSADPSRYLIGDDEHGWSANSVFNFEGGCYAKCINLSEKNEPMIWNAIRDTAIVENVVVNADGELDYNDDRFTQNTRAVYPLEFIKKRVVANHAGIPNAVLFLTCDLYGVLPPIGILTKEQAAYYFLSGYTALVGSTEIGSTAAVQPTFSTCFGAPFFPRPAMVYAKLLMKRIVESGCQVYLINTGWTGGAYGEGGQRFSIPTTRAIVHAAISGKLKNLPQTILPGFNIAIPTEAPDVDAQLLDPRKSWKNPADYEKFAAKLIVQFQENFKKFDVAKDIVEAGPVSTVDVS